MSEKNTNKSPLINPNKLGKKKLNIGMVLNGYYPSDIRVRKEAESLATQFNVFVLCVKNKNEVESEIVNGVHVKRLISYKSFTQKGIIDIIVAVRFIHPFFKNQLDSYIKTNGIDILHVHDLPLAKTAYLSAKKHAIKIIIDLHENYPEALKTWFSWRKSFAIRLKNKLFFSYKRWANYEKNILPKFDKIIAVADEMKERLITKHQIESSKIIVITNSEKKEFAKEFIINKQQNSILDSNRYNIVYVGGIGPHRGIQTAIKGMKHLYKEIPNVLLSIVGPGHKDVIAHLKQLVTDDSVENIVQFLGKQPFQHIPQIMQTSDINIIPHEKNEHTDSAIPHKLFQILMSGKPLLVSDCRSFQRVIATNEIGYLFRAGDPLDFAKKIIEIYKNNSLSKKRSAKGKKLCLHGELNWETTATKLIELYKNMSV